jgi:flagellar motor switch protein FliM
MALTEKKENGVKLYDFKSNILLQPEELKSIKFLSESFTEMLSFAFSSHFKRPFIVRYRETVVNKFGQAAKKLKMPVVVARVGIEGLEGEIFMQIDRNLSYLMTDGFLGGDSKKSEERHEITGIEERILFRTCERILKHFERALPKNLRYSFEIKEVIKKAENFEIHTQDDLVTTIHFDVNFADNQGGIVLGFPSFLLEPVLKKGAKKPVPQEKKNSSQETIETKAKRLKDVPVECKVVLSGINIRLKDLVDIQPGDCVTLDHDIYKPLTVTIGGKAKFLAMPGLRGKKLAVKVTACIKGGKENG